MSRRLPQLVAVLLAAVLVGSACSSSSPPPQGGEGGTLQLAYLADMAQADPDVFYDIEGNTVILSVYEGLVKYKPDSTEIIPSLAESWEVSPDGLTYTFKLRSGVKFQDGTPFDSQAVKTSFQRRLDVGAAPSYMLEPVASMQTPDATTFVMRLKHPVAPFLHYMASSWGPKVISPKALTDHAGKDHAQTWLNEHAVGTGPFQLTAFERGQRYELTRSTAIGDRRPTSTRSRSASSPTSEPSACNSNQVTWMRFSTRSRRQSWSRPRATPTCRYGTSPRSSTTSSTSTPTRSRCLIRRCARRWPVRSTVTHW